MRRRRKKKFNKGKKGKENKKEEEEKKNETELRARQALKPVDPTMFSQCTRYTYDNLKGQLMNLKNH
jgi:hypothetical protein